MFCEQCDNLLYPQVSTNKTTSLLMMCKKGDNMQHPISNILSFSNYAKRTEDVIDKNIAHELAETMSLPLAINKTCLECYSNNIAFFDPKGMGIDEHKDLIIGYICLDCEHWWD